MRPDHCSELWLSCRWGGSSEAQSNNERATRALGLGTSGTACSRAWLGISRKSFRCGGPHAPGGSNCLVSAVQARRGVVKSSPPMRRDRLRPTWRRCRRVRSYLPFDFVSAASPLPHRPHKFCFDYERGRETAIDG